MFLSNDLTHAIKFESNFEQEVRKRQKEFVGEDKRVFNTKVNIAKTYQSITNAFDTIYKDRLLNKNVKNYTLVLFGDKLIVAKNFIHKLILIIFGGRTSQVGVMIDRYLDSKEYKESINIALQENQSVELCEKQKIRVQSNLDVISKFGVVNKLKKEDLKNLLYKLIPTKEEAIKLVSKDGYKLEFLSDEFKKNKDVVLAAVLQNGHALKHASDKLKKDKQVVLAAVNNSKFGFAILSAHSSFLSDKDVALAAIYQNSGLFHSLNDNLKEDKDFVLAAVSQNPRLFEILNQNLKDDKEVVLAAQRSRNRFVC
jgi:hypothetical protein